MFRFKTVWNFVVPSGWDWTIAVIFALSRCRGRRTSRQDRRRMWATHLSLVVTAFCSRPRLKFVRWLVVEGVLHVYTRYLDIRICSWTTRCTFPPLFSAGSSKQILEDCLLLLAVALFERSEFLSATSKKKKTDRLCVCGCTANPGFSVEKLSWF